jgi:valyl-tRNA synthetase
MDVIQKIVTEIRQSRASNKIDKSQALIASISAPPAAFLVIEQNRKAIERLANVTLTLEQGPPAVKLDIPLDRARLEKENEQLEKVIANSKRQLDNAEIVAKMPEKVVATLRSKLAEYEAQLAKNRAALAE